MSALQFRPRSDIRFRVIAGEAVVLRQEVGETLVLNEVGARVLQLLAEGWSLEVLPGRIAEEFAVEAPQAEADTATFVQELIAAGVLEVVSPVQTGSRETGSTEEGALCRS